jgi:hypothetical protein
MKRNFEVDGTIGIVVDGRYFDLRNDYNFSKLEYDVSANSLVLSWDHDKKSKDGLRIFFGDVIVFKVREADHLIPAREGKVVHTIGFVRPEDIDNLSSFIPNRPEDSYHLLVEFANGLAVKIFSNEATVVVERSS